MDTTKSGELAVGECGNWYASHDFMPVGKPTLRVGGQCTFPTPGYKVVLRKSEPQGINERILILDKVVTPPSGVVPQVVTIVDVDVYVEETSMKYDQVQILSLAT